MRRVYFGIGSPYGWGCSRWSEEQWNDWLSTECKRWVAFVDMTPIGMVMLVRQENQTVEIRVFGLTAEWVGKGYGGHVLTLAVERAWGVIHKVAKPTKRVWLHTSSRDHESAKSNYVARGFETFDVRTEANASNSGLT